MPFFQRLVAAATAFLAAVSLLGGVHAVESILAGVQSVGQPTWTGPGDPFYPSWNVGSFGQPFTIPVNAQNWTLDAFAFYFVSLDYTTVAAYVYEWDNDNMMVLGAPMWSNTSIAVLQRSTSFVPAGAQFTVPVSPTLPLAAGKQYIAILSRITSGGYEPEALANFFGLSDAVYSGGGGFAYLHTATTLAGMEGSPWVATLNIEGARVSSNLVSWFSFQSPTTSSPTVVPTARPTVAPTDFPTFAPPPPGDPVQPVATNHVCGPEIFLTQQRELGGGATFAEEEGRTGVQASAVQRSLTVWTPDTCYYACKERLNNPPTFVINIYEEEGQQVCTCCRICESWRYVPGAQIFARCTAGDGASSLVRFTSKASHEKGGVAPGKVVIYKALVRNVDMAAVAQGLALTVRLPVAGLTFVASRASHGYRLKGDAGWKKRAYIRAKGPTAIVNHTSTPQAVTWHDLVLPPRKGMTFAIKVRVSGPGAHPGTPLVFSGSVYQQLPANGLPYCSTMSADRTVFVK